MEPNFGTPGSTIGKSGFSPRVRTRATLILMILSQAFSGTLAEAVEPTNSDLEFAIVDDIPLRLDLYLPKKGSEDRQAFGPPLIVWVHGGAWRAGSKSSVPIKDLVNQGFAIASVEYRLSSQAAFPAQVHDIKAAIRWLRESASKYGYDPDQVVIAGASAGGHLAALVGVSAKHPDLNGSVAPNSQAADVAAIVSFYGASNLETILDQSTPHGLNVRIPALQLLLRAQPEQDPALAKLASPVNHVGKDDPPILLFHGDQDPQMPINQSHELQGAYDRAGVEAIFDVVHGGAHGGAEFYTAERLSRVAEFFRTALAESQTRQ